MNTPAAIQVKNLLPIEFCQFFTHVLLRNSTEPNSAGDEQVPNCLSIMDHEVMFETVLERIWPAVESVVKEELIPTYSYARLYSNGDTLESHTDRPACEISLTVQLGRSHHYAWPIYVNGQRFDLAEGDAVLYQGCEVPHWREQCVGPEGYYSGQVFFHFVRKNGPHANEAGDSTKRNPPSFVKNRTVAMEAK